MEKIKSIVFDMGGVITVDNFEEVLRQIAVAYKIPFEELSVLRKKYSSKMTLGEFSQKELVKLIKETYSLEKPLEELLEIWKKIYIKGTPLIKDTCSLSAKLRKKYAVGMLSNLYDFHTDINKERGIYDGFFPCIVSNRVHYAKPGKEIYQLYLSQAKVKPEECVFIDDKEEFTRVAKELGFNVILFKDPESLIKELKALGVEVDD
jgi:putative hydrolase of the HAD superfamily